MNKIFETYDRQEGQNESQVVDNRLVVEAPTNIKKVFNIKNKLCSLMLTQGSGAEIVFKSTISELPNVEQAVAQFSLYGANNKPVLSKNFDAKEIFNEAGEFTVKLDGLDTKELKRESYKMELCLIENDNLTKIFSEATPLLTIR